MVDDVFEVEATCCSRKVLNFFFKAFDFKYFFEFYWPGADDFVIE